MNLIVLSKDERLRLAQMLLDVSSLSTDVSALKQHITHIGVTSDKYVSVMETERDLAMLCLDQIGVSLSDVRRYLRNLKELVE